MGGIVVADSGPLHYLILIDRAEVLSALFAHVLVPFAVQRELSHANASAKVKNWINESRPWLELVPVAHPLAVAGLHPGESEALQLALQRRAALVLMDDLDGRAAARRLGLRVVGTIGILERGAELGLLDLSKSFRELRMTNFFAADELFEAALARERRRKGT